MHCSACGLIIGKEAPDDLCRCPRCAQALRVLAYRREDGFERPGFVPIVGERKRFAELYVSEAMIRFDLPARSSRPADWEPLLAELELERLKCFAREKGWVVAGAFRDPGPGRSESDRPFGRIAADLAEGIANSVLVTEFARVPRRDLHALHALTEEHGGELLSIHPHPVDPDLRLDHVDYDTVPDSAGDVPALAKMWGAGAERALAELVGAAGWHWTFYAADALAHAFGVDNVRAWRERAEPGTRSWKETLGRFAIARARRAGLLRTLPLPRLLNCVLCRRRYLDAAIPVRMMEICAGRMSYCGRCLSRAFFAGEASWVGPPNVDSMADAERGTQFFRDLTRERLHLFLKTVLGRVAEAESRDETPHASDTWLGTLAEQGYLGAYGAVTRSDSYFRAADGHLAPNLGAAMLDNWLAAHGIAHRVDARYPHDQELNPSSLVRADFLANGVPIEFVGMRGRDEFGKHLALRVEVLRRADLPLVALWADDLLTPAVVERKMAPVLAAGEAAAARNEEPKP